MSLGYTIAYRIGFTPWERAGRAGAKELSSLFEREETGRGVPFGRALDLGCGTGAHTIELAGRGWQATGIDMVPVRCRWRGSGRPRRAPETASGSSGAT